MSTWNYNHLESENISSCKEKYSGKIHLKKLALIPITAVAIATPFTFVAQITSPSLSYAYVPPEEYRYYVSDWNSFKRWPLHIMKDKYHGNRYMEGNLNREGTVKYCYMNHRDIPAWPRIVHITGYGKIDRSMWDEYIKMRMGTDVESVIDIGKNVLLPDDCHDLFEYHAGVIRMDPNLDTSNITNMSGMFRKVQLNYDRWRYDWFQGGATPFDNSTPDFSRWDVSNVTTMRRMFDEASGFQEICFTNGTLGKNVDSVDLTGFVSFWNTYRELRKVHLVSPKEISLKPGGSIYDSRYDGYGIYLKKTLDSDCKFLEYHKKFIQTKDHLHPLTGYEILIKGMDSWNAPQLLDKDNIASIAIKTPPTKLTYTEGEEFKVDGTVLTLKDIYGVTKDITPSEFGENGVSVMPEHLSADKKLTHQSSKVVFACKGKTAAQAITVNKKVLPKLVLKTPNTKVKVNNPNRLSEDEKKKVKKAIVEANTPSDPAISEQDIQVNPDGTSTITKDGYQDKIISGTNLVEEDTDLHVTTPTPKIKVQDPTQLSEDDKAKVRKAIKGANVGKNLTDQEIDIKPNGDTTITRGNKISTIKGSDLVEKNTVQNGGTGNNNTGSGNGSGTTGSGDTGTTGNGAGGSGDANNAGKVDGGNSGNSGNTSNSSSTGTSGNAENMGSSPNSSVSQLDSTPNATQRIGLHSRRYNANKKRIVPQTSDFFEIPTLSISALGVVLGVIGMRNTHRKGK